MTKKIQKTAVEFQDLNRELKEIQAKMKPLKKELTTYAEKHKADFDKAFQMKFPNGTYISLRVKDILDGPKVGKEQLLTEVADNYKETKLDEKSILADVPKDPRLRKLLTKLKIEVTQKESFAVYAG